MNKIIKLDRESSNLSFVSLKNIDCFIKKYWFHQLKLYAIKNKLILKTEN